MKNKQRNHHNKLDDPEIWWKMNPNPWDKWTVDTSNHTQRQQENIDNEATDQPRYSFFKHFKYQLIISCMFFVLIIGLGKLPNPSIQQGKVWLREALNKPFNFVAVAGYYEQLFKGSPSFIPSFGNRSEQVLAKHHAVTDIVAPLKNASIVQSFVDTFVGIELAGDDAGEVMAVEKGRVILVRDQQDSVIIQHANNKISIYAKLDQVYVDVSDWVEAGTVIGRLPKTTAATQSQLFFALKQNDQYIDPLEVIPIE